MTSSTLTPPADTGVPPQAQGSVTLAEGRYENGKGAWLEVLDVQMPGYPKYDGGMTGVSILWGKQRLFVVARNEAHFWSKWPFILCAPSQNTAVRHAEDKL